MLSSLRVSSFRSARQVASTRRSLHSISATSTSSTRSSSSLLLPSTNNQTKRQILTCLPRSSTSLLSASRSFHLSSIHREVVKVPQMAESISEGTLKQWVKKKGDFVKADEEVATIETDKIDVSVNAPQSGTIVELYAEEEDTVEVGKDLFKLEPGEEPSGGESQEASSSESKDSESEPSTDKKEGEDGGNKQESQPNKDQEENKEGKQQGGGDTKPKPKPQSSASESSSSGSGSGSGSSSPSKKPESKSPSKKPESSSSSSKPDTKTPATPGSRDETRVKMSRMRLRIAERLKQSQNTAASLTTFNEIDMTNLMKFRKQHKDDVLKHHGVKLGFMSAFAKASAVALKEIPAANASIEGDGLGDTIVYRDYVDLSVAVSTEKGLVTPVVRNVEGMGLIQIEREIAELGKKARDNKLTIEDMAGGTFTISNGGVFGSLFGTPILNLPGSAILGMHAIKDKAWVVDGKVEVRPIMVVALTYDHRLLDGREAVTFLVKLKQYIEDMGSMLL